MIYPAPKPTPKAPRPVKRTSHNSTIPDKPFTVKLEAKRKLQSKQTPIPKKNTKRQERQAVIRRQKHQAYRRSECYKAVEKRANGQCERVHSHYSHMHDRDLETRCGNKRSDGLRMTHNHKTYARYGGDELPGDMELLCPTCNASYESSKRGTRRFLGAGGR